MWFYTITYKHQHTCSSSSPRFKKLENHILHRHYKQAQFPDTHSA